MTKKDNLFVWLYGFTKQYAGLMFVGVFFSLLVAGCEIFSVYALEKFINGIFGEERKLAINLILYAVIIFVIGGVANYFMIKSSRTFAAVSMAEMKSSFTRHMQKSLIKDIDSKNTGQRISEFTNNMNLIETFYSNFINTYLHTPLMIVVVCVYLLCVNWKLLLISICTMPISVWISKVVSNPMERYVSSYFGKLGEANNIVKENVEGVEIVKSFILQNRFCTRYRHVMKCAFKENMKMARQESFMMPFVIISYELPYIICAVAGGYLATRSSNFYVGDIVAFLQLLSFLVNPISQLSNIISELRKVEGTAAEIKSFMENEIEQGGEFLPDDSSPAVEFNDVTFSYDKDHRILNGFSLKIEKNKRIALVGESGSGKSTVLNLISGFCFPDSGNVSVMGCPISPLNIGSSRKYISRVDQDIFLFNDSIRQNIIYGAEEIDEVMFGDILEKSELNGFIKELPKGADTVLNENGKNVSGGQRQRIAVARAFIKQAPILLLDEPTASLDDYTQEVIQRSINELSKGRTTITVAHRLSTIKDYDDIIVLSNGEITERGTHDELIALNGYYSRLYRESGQNN